MRRDSKIVKILITLFLIVGSFVSIFPLLWLFKTSLTSLGQVFQMPPVWIPKPLEFSNYAKALTTLPFGRYFLNSTFIVVFSVLGAICSSSISAYGFARIKWPGRDIVFAVILSSMMLPYAVTLIPTFIGWSKLNAINTYFPLILPYWFGIPPFYLFLLRQFYLTIPKDLDEAAHIDGAGHFQIFFRIIIPLVKPALIVVGLFSFLMSWNDFLGPLVYINDQSKFTVALGLSQFIGSYSAEWNLMMAAATVVLIPAIVIFFIGQKYFVEGITLTGIKG